jgi:hypothetical protein
MKTITTTLFGACLALATASAMAQTAPQPADGQKEPTVQECKDLMAKKDMAKKDDATMKKEQACADVLKKDSAAPKK